MKDILKYIVPYFLLIIVIFLSGRLGIDRDIILPTGMAILAVYYLRIDNPHKTLLNLFSISIIVCFTASMASYAGWSSLFLKIGLALAALIYLYRFLKREEKLWIDYLKVFCIIIGAALIIVMPEALPALSATLGFTYILDRFIIRRQMKKTTQIILFSFLALVCITFVIYGQIKANEAFKNSEMAKAAQEEAMQAADMAGQQAQNAAAHAIMQAAEMTKLQAELEECKSK